jgi:hypothetical protein
LKRSAVVAWVAFVAALVAWITPARALERNFAGSAQLDYAFVPTAQNLKTSPNAFDGFTMELAGKLAVDFSDHISANLKVCYGCHGIEVDMMYFDVRVADELNFRIGRFSPSFGAFNLRHDPANHRLSDKPLPYDMGRMLRLRQWNMSVLPSPFPDNGVEINGTHTGEAVQFDYAVYGVTGFKADLQPTDLNFQLSRRPEAYYTDNNARPSLGARVALTFKLGEASDLTAGLSGVGGTYDPENHETYFIGGADISARLDKTNIRFEYLARRTTFDIGNRTVYKYIVPYEDENFFMKHGAYLEVEHGLTPELDLIGRVDGMFRQGNIEAASPLTSKASVYRYTLGTAYAIERGIRIKLSTELWQFSNADVVSNRKIELSMHAALAGSF